MNLRIGLALVELGEAIIEYSQGARQDSSPVTAPAAPAGVTPLASAGAPNPPQCPTHHRDWKMGKFGWFCTAQAAPGERADKRGYCAERPAA